MIQDFSFLFGFCYNLVCKVWNVLNGKFEGISVKEKGTDLYCAYKYELGGGFIDF